MAELVFFSHFLLLTTNNKQQQQLTTHNKQQTTKAFLEQIERESEFRQKTLLNFQMLISLSSLVV